MKFRIPRLRDVDRLFRRRRAERSLTLHLPFRSNGLREVSIARGPTAEDAEFRFVLRKEGRRLVLSFDHWTVFGDDRLFGVFSHRPGVLVHTFAATLPTVTEAVADISDGRGGGRGIIGFCSQDPGAILIPDPDFYSSGGYSSVRSIARTDGPAWSERDATIVWRGSTTGRGLITTDDMSPGDSRLIQRTRLCLAVRAVPGIDAKLCQVGQSADPKRDLDRLRAAGIFAERIDTATWRNRKFAIDIDGNSNAWSNLFTRLLLGCCVIKIGSPFGFRQWYYDRLRPFEHFVPAAADLSDLSEKIEWCHAHERECAAIASAGQEFALRRTLESEISSTVELLNQTCQSVGPADRRNAM